MYWLRIRFYLVITFELLACDNPYRQQACRLDSESVLAVLKHIPTAVAVIPVGKDRFAAAWSGKDGTWVVQVDGKGRPLARPRRIVLRPLGIDQFAENPKTFWPSDERESLSAEALTLVELTDGSIMLAGIERAENRDRGGAYLAHVPLDPTRPMQTIQLGEAGEYGSSIAAVRLQDRLIVAWHEGALATSTVQMAVLSFDPLHVHRRQSFEYGHVLASPTLASIGQSALLAWSRTVQDAEGPMSEVLAVQLDTSLRLNRHTVVNRGRYLDSRPFAMPISDHFGLVFRDDRDPDGTAEFYFTRLDKKASMLQSPRRISRADGFRGPQIAGVQPVYSAAVRSFQRNLLIGLNRFDLRGTKLGGEFQVYADKSDFIRVALAVRDSSVLLVYGEDRQGSGRVLSARVECRD